MEPLILFKKAWFEHPEWWFETRLETDLYLTQKYGHWLEESLMDYSWDWTKETLIAWILLYDQLPRHIARATSKNTIYTYLAKAVGLVQLVIEDGFKSFFPMEQFTGEEFGFLMLPLRHTYDCKMTYLAMKYMWEKMETDKKQSQHKYVEQLKPFLKATYKRCPMLPLDPKDSYTYTDYFQVFKEKEINTNTDNSVPVSSTPLFQWDKHKSVIAYTPEFMFEGERQSVDDDWINGWKIPTQADTTIVSLSGGVDSMVLLWILIKKYRLNPVAVYINYCNRDDDEERFIRDWCHYLNVTLYVRRIREIQRVPAMAFELREVYETYTRNCRFHAYHQVHTEQPQLSTRPFVAMGHNQDDCFENILTNICQKQKYDNLRGMTTLMETNGIEFWRPMLHIPKYKIYNFAQKNTIPYVCDSTPKWSCRGKIRDVVRPTLEQYHSTMIPAFFHLSQTLSELTQYMEHFSEILYKKTQDAVLKVALADYPVSLWTTTQLWQRYFQKYGSFCPSHRSLCHLCERMTNLLDTNKTKVRLNVVLKKGYSVTVEKSDSMLTFTFITQTS